jgi:hypothetical protein
MKMVSYLPREFHDMKRRFDRESKSWVYSNRFLSITVMPKEGMDTLCDVFYIVDGVRGPRVWTNPYTLMAVMESTWNKALQEVRLALKGKEHEIKVIQRNINLTRAWLSYVTGEDQRPPPDFWERLDASE